MSFLYDKFKEKLMTQTLGGPMGAEAGGCTCSMADSTTDIRAQLLNANYIASRTTHEYFSQIPSGARVSDPVSLTGKSVSGRTFDADNVEFPLVAANNTVVAYVLYLNRDTEAESPLIAYFDGFTIETIGTDVQLRFDNSGIFDL